VNNVRGERRKKEGIVSTVLERKKGKKGEYWGEKRGGGNTSPLVCVGRKERKGRTQQLIIRRGEKEGKGGN